MLSSHDLPPHDENLSQCDYTLLHQELQEAHTQNRSLHRQLEKALAAVAEAQRAHAKMVQTLSETMRENMVLTNDRDTWRNRAQRLAAGLSAEPGYAPHLDLSNLSGHLSEDEIKAIRKAMARLHHPDVGGNPDRMKAWNATLDRLMS